MSTTARTALVLGGGGITGIAWELGVLAGLADAGVDVTTATRVIGTSAGSVVGAQVTAGVALDELYEQQLEPPSRERAAALGRATLLRYGLAMMAARGDGTAFRRRVGSLARKAADAGRTPTEQQRIDVIGSRLPSADWPDRDLIVTAVDTATGEPRFFDRAAGAPLRVAVAASCAVPGVYPPVTIDGLRFMDGGLRSTANVDLASGCDPIVVLAPLPRGVGPMASVTSQARALDGRVVIVTPDDGSVAAIGRNVLDPAARAASARAGREQGRREADRVRDVWPGPLLE